MTVYGLFVGGVPTAFYTSDIHLIMPEGVVEVSIEDWQAYLSAPAAWMRDPVTGARIAVVPPA